MVQETSFTPVVDSVKPANVNMVPGSLTPSTRTRISPLVAGSGGHVHDAVQAVHLDGAEDTVGLFLLPHRTHVVVFEIEIIVGFRRFAGVPLGPELTRADPRTAVPVRVEVDVIPRTSVDVPGSNGEWCGQRLGTQQIGRAGEVPDRGW